MTPEQQFFMGIGVIVSGLLVVLIITEVLLRLSDWWKR